MFNIAFFFSCMPKSIKRDINGVLLCVSVSGTLMKTTVSADRPISTCTLTWVTFWKTALLEVVKLSTQKPQHWINVTSRPLHALKRVRRVRFPMSSLWIRASVLWCNNRFDLFLFYHFQMYSLSHDALVVHRKERKKRNTCWINTKLDELAKEGKRNIKKIQIKKVQI